MVRDASMRNIPELVTDARLERLPLARARASAEAYALLELREVRSAGDNDFAFKAMAATRSDQ